MSRTILRAALLACGIATTPAAARVTGVPPQQTQSRAVHWFVDRFNAAKTTHDGRLTSEQAQADTGAVLQ